MITKTEQVMQLRALRPPLSYDEIARRLSTTPAAARTMHHQGVKRDWQRRQVLRLTPEESEWVSAECKSLNLTMNELFVSLIRDAMAEDRP